MKVYLCVCVCVCARALLSRFGFEGGMWDFIVLVPDHCLSFYFAVQFRNRIDSYFAQSIGTCKSAGMIVCFQLALGIEF